MRLPAGDTPAPPEGETPGAYPWVREDVSQASDAAIEGKREGMRREKSSTLLGTAEVADSVEVLWPDGATNSGANVPAGFHRIVRP